MSLSKLRFFPRLPVALVALVVLVVLTVVACGRDEAPKPISWNGRAVDPPVPAPALEGTDWTGEPFVLAEAIEGKVGVVFFGYTFCPDICPMTLAKLVQVESALGEAADDLEVVFVSVDPHRDTLEKMATYVPAFDRSFHGVRLEPGELEAVQDEWGVVVQIGQPKDGPGTDSYYYVDHTGTYFVIDRQGRSRLEFPPNVEPETMVPDLRALLAEEAPADGSSQRGEDSSRDALEVRSASAMLFPSAGAVYFEVENAGDSAVRLLSVATPAGRATLHETLEVDGVMKMEARENGFEIPPGGTLLLEPGGAHVMLEEVDVPSEDETIELTLRFDGAGDLLVDVPITKRIDAASGDGTRPAGPEE